MLSASFTILKITGYWKPRHWVSPLLSWIYTLHMSLSFLIIFSFTLTGIIGLALRHDDIVEVTNDCFILLSVFAVCGKIVNVVSQRGIIIDIIDTMQSDPCAPRDEDETKLQDDVDRFFRINTIVYAILTEMTAMTVTFSTLMENIETGGLPFNTYIPWEHSHGMLYWLAYGYQLFGLALSANVAIGWDTLITGLIVQVSAKINILKLRFSKLADLLELNMAGKGTCAETKLREEKELVADSVKCHHIILRLAANINSIFNAVIFFQFSISAIVLCVSVYNLANMQLFSAEFTATTLYLACMLMEIFILCAAGNEVTLVSGSMGDAIYDMNWVNLNPLTLRSLLIVMTRTLHPVVFTSGYVITLSLDSFKSLIKISYSSFNVLQQT